MTSAGSNGRFSQRARLAGSVKSCGPPWPAGRMQPKAPPLHSCVLPQSMTAASAGAWGGALSAAAAAAAAEEEEEREAEDGGPRAASERRFGGGPSNGSSGRFAVRSRS